MKKLISAVLALSLLGTVAATAQPYGGNAGNQNRYQDRSGYQDNYRGYQNDNRGYQNNRGFRNNDHRNDGAAVGVGIGLFALLAILASSNHQSERRPVYNNGYYGR